MTRCDATRRPQVESFAAWQTCPLAGGFLPLRSRSAAMALCELSANTVRFNSGIDASRVSS